MADPVRGIDGRNYRAWGLGEGVGAPGGGTLGPEGKLRALDKAGGVGHGGAAGSRIVG